MTEFQSQIRERVREAVSSLEDARANDDVHLVQIRTGELEDLARIAFEHGMHLPHLAGYVDLESAAG